MSYPNDNLMDKLDDVMSDASTASSALATIQSGTDAVVANFNGLKDLVDALSAFATTLKTEGFYAPVGLISPFGGLSTEIPGGWLLCDGSAVSRTTYADLYAVLGANAYGTDPVGQFYLPDLRGRVPFGLNSANSDTDARTDNDGLSAANRRPKHSHTVTDPGHKHTTYLTQVQNVYGDRAYPGGGDRFGFGNYESSTNTTGITVGPAAPSTGGTPVDMVPYVITNYIIKY